MVRLLVVAVAGVSLAGCSQGGGASQAAAPPVVSPTVAVVQGLSAGQVAVRLKAAGVPLEVTVVYTAETDPNHLLGRPDGYSSKLAFADARIKAAEVADIDPTSPDRGGSIEVFGNAVAAEARARDIEAKIKAMGGILTSEYHYVRGGVLVRVSGLLTPAEAKLYGKALARVVV